MELQTFRRPLCRRNRNIAKGHDSESIPEGVLGLRLLRFGNAPLCHDEYDGSFAFGANTKEQYRVPFLRGWPYDVHLPTVDGEIARGLGQVL